MTRFFNTGGPCKPDIHFMLPPTRRLPEVREIIDRQSYFALHAPRQSREQLVAIELKVWRDKQGDPLREGLAQLEGYLGRLGLAEGFLVIFDRRRSADEVPWDERPRWEDEALPGGKRVRVLRL